MKFLFQMYDKNYLFQKSTDTRESYLSPVYIRPVIKKFKSDNQNIFIIPRENVVTKVGKRRVSVIRKNKIKKTIPKRILIKRIEDKNVIPLKVIPAKVEENEPPEYEFIVSTEDKNDMDLDKSNNEVSSISYFKPPETNDQSNETPNTTMQEEDKTLDFVPFMLDIKTESSINSTNQLKEQDENPNEKSFESKDETNLNKDKKKKRKKFIFVGCCFCTPITIIIGIVIGLIVTLLLMNVTTSVTSTEVTVTTTASTTLSTTTGQARNYYHLKNILNII